MRDGSSGEQGTSEARALLPHEYGRGKTPEHRNGLGIFLREVHGRIVGRHEQRPEQTRPEQTRLEAQGHDDGRLGGAVGLRGRAPHTDVVLDEQRCGAKRSASTEALAEGDLVIDQTLRWSGGHGHEGLALRVPTAHMSAVAAHESDSLCDDADQKLARVALFSEKANQAKTGRLLLFEPTLRVPCTSLRHPSALCLRVLPRLPDA